MKNKKIVIISLAVVLVLAIAAGAVWYLYDQNNYVAKVNGNKITKAEFMYYLMDYKTSVEQSQSLTDDTAKRNFWQSKAPDGRIMEDIAKEYALQSTKQVETYLIKAKQQNITLEQSDKDAIKQEIDSMVQNADGKRIEADKQCKTSYGVTLAQYESINLDLTLIRKYFTQELKNQESKITDADITKAYNDSPNAYAKVGVRHILYLTSDATTGEALADDKKAEVKQKAQAMMDRVKAGEDMAALAKANSEDPGAATNSGLYVYDKYGMYDDNGQYTAFSSSTGDLDADFKGWAADKNVGDVGIIETSYGYHVMKLESRDAITLDSVKDKIKSEMANTKLNEDFSNAMSDPNYNLVKNDTVYNSIKVMG